MSNQLPPQSSEAEESVLGAILIDGDAITEVGVFDAAGTGSPPTGGNMDIYGDFSVINLAASDSIAFTIKVSFV